MTSCGTHACTIRLCLLHTSAWIDYTTLSILCSGQFVVIANPAPALLLFAPQELLLRRGLSSLHKPNCAHSGTAHVRAGRWNRRQRSFKVTGERKLSDLPNEILRSICYWLYETDPAGGY